MAAPFQTEHSATLVVSQACRPLLKSSEVMMRFGYRNRTSFHAWVKSQAVPHIRINSRRIMFSEAALSDWLAAHSSTGKAAF